MIFLGIENPPELKFCGQCATVFRYRASAPSLRFAASEVMATASALAHELPPAEGFEGERKTVTALFADIKGSTELMRDLDPEEARAIVDPVLQLMMAAVHRYGGYVAQSTGDGIFALFGAPVAHEDHPQRALHAALAMQDASRVVSLRQSARGCDSAVEARVGMNTGEVVTLTIGPTDIPNIRRSVTDRQSRVTDADGGAGGFDCGHRDARRLVEGYFSFRELGPTAVKGLDAPVEVYEVVRAGPAADALPARGAARADEVRRTRGRAAADQGCAGTGRAAGTGSLSQLWPRPAPASRDCSTSSKRHCRPNASCSKPTRYLHGKASAWLPVLELVRSYFGIRGRGGSTDAAREGPAPALIALDPRARRYAALPVRVIWYFRRLSTHLLQMDPQIKRRRTLDALKRIILRESLSTNLRSSSLKTSIG